jgi:serine/threonine protein kinase
MEFFNAYKLIMAAVCAEDLFGEINTEREEAPMERVDEVYEDLAVVRPDRNQDNPDILVMAHEAFARLNQFYSSAETKIASGSYGSRREYGQLSAGQGSTVIQAGSRSYVVRDFLAEGDLADLYSGVCVEADEFAQQVVIKIIADAEDNLFGQTEIRVLEAFAREPGNQNKHLPYFLDQFRTKDNKVGLVLRHLVGHNLPRVRETYPDGIPPIHAVWMFSRLLSAVGYAHYRGIIHGNIDPSHVMISPSDHNVFLIDWSYAAIRPKVTGEGFKVFNPNFSAPEVQDKLPPIPASDMYSVGKVMVYMLGGNVETGEMPASVDERLQRFVQNFLLASSVGRAQDAWDMFRYLQILREQIFGEIKFLEFRV